MFPCPDVESVSPRDIAHALSLICRFGGHCKRFYSVGEHSIYCHDEARRRGWRASICLMCLVHDGGEAYVGDMIRPVKTARGMKGYNRLSESVQDRVYESFMSEVGEYWESESIKSIVSGVDNAVIVAEFARLMRNGGGGLSRFDGIEPAKIPRWQWFWHRLPGTVERGFLKRLKRHGVRL